MKKRFISALLSIALILPIGSFSAQASEFTYTETIAPQYEDAQWFTQGLAPVKQNGKWGYIDEAGKTVINFKYDVAFPFSESRAVVGKKTTRTLDYGWGEFQEVTINFCLIDLTGKEIAIEGGYSYSMLDSETDDYYAMLKNKNLTFYNGYLAFFKAIENDYNSFMGTVIIDTNGKIKYELEDMITNFSVTDDVLSVSHLIMDSAYFFDLKTGSLTTGSAKYGETRPYNQGLALVWDYAKGGWYFIDKTGKQAISTPYQGFYVQGLNTEYRVFGDNEMAVVQLENGMWGAINKTGKTVIPFKYKELRGFSEGVAAFKENDKFGYMDIYGNVVIKPQFDDVSTFNGGLAVARVGNTAYCIDKTGNKVVGSEKLPIDSYFIDNGDGTHIIYSPASSVIIKENGKYGYGKIDFTPSLPTKAEMDSWAFDEVTKAIENNLVPVNLQNMYKTNTTRVDFAALVVCAIEEVLGEDIDDIVKEKTGKSIDTLTQNYTFKDTVDKNVVAANALGIINGVSINEFAPYKSISRQDAAALLMRTSKFLGADEKADTKEFTDSADVAGYAKEAVEFVASNGIMGGVGENKFAPKGTYTRQQAYLTFYRLFNVVTEK